jgi:hypothetical protein
MKALFAVGLVVLVLGLVSLVVPLPHTERTGVQLGGVSVGVNTHHSETVSPVVSGLLILVGAGLIAAGKMRKA